MNFHSFNPFPARLRSTWVERRNTMHRMLKGAIAATAIAFTAPAGAVGSLADVTVYDRTEGKRLQVYRHQGRAYVVGKPGNEYQVSLRNRAGDDVLAIVSVDGVNVITGQSAAPQQSGYVLAPRGGMEILGWRKSMAETAAFYFTPLPDSYAARTGRPDDVGVIGVALFRKKSVAPPAPVGQPFPGPYSDRAPAAAGRGMEREDAASKSAEAQLGTGHGRREVSQAQYVNFERASSAPAELVTLYYDSYRNLVAKGIIRETAPLAPLPRPFPGFVPDPA
jgi:hypothetical protein